MSCSYPGCKIDTEWPEDPLCLFHSRFCPQENWNSSRTLMFLNSERRGRKEASLVASQKFEESSRNLPPRLVALHQENPSDPTLQIKIQKEIERRGIKHYPKNDSSLFNEYQREVFETFIRERGAIILAVMHRGSGKTTLASRMIIRQVNSILTQDRYPYSGHYPPSNGVSFLYVCKRKEEGRVFMENCYQFLKNLGHLFERRASSEITLMNRKGGFPIRVVSRSCLAKGVRGGNYHTVILEDIGEWPPIEWRGVVRENLARKMWEATYPQYTFSRQFGGNYVILSPRPRPNSFWADLLKNEHDNFIVISSD